MIRLRWAGALVSALALALVGASAGLQAQNRPADAGEGVAMVVAFVAFALVGGVIVFKRPANAIGWSFLTITFFAGLTGAASEYGLLVGRTQGFGTLPVRVCAWIGNWTWWIPITVMPTFPLLLFPNGRPPSPRWRWVVYLAGAGVSLGALGFALDAERIELGGDGPLVAPLIGATALQPLSDVLSVVGFPLALSAAALSIVSLIVRFRRARGDERQQIKWVAYAGSVMTVFFLLGAANKTIGNNDWVFAAAVTPVPVAAAVAVLRYRLYDIDVIINRTLVYGALTAILAGAYFGLVVAFQTLLEPVTRQSDVAVAASTLGVAALFGPLRRRVQEFIDRRFYRSRYDAQQTLSSFAARLRDEVELERLSSELLEVVSATMRPRYASLWLRTGDTQ